MFRGFQIEAASEERRLSEARLSNQVAQERELRGQMMQWMESGVRHLFNRGALCVKLVCVRAGVVFVCVRACACV